MSDLGAKLATRSQEIPPNVCMFSPPAATPLGHSHVSSKSTSPSSPANASRRLSTSRCREGRAGVIAFSALQEKADDASHDAGVGYRGEEGEGEGEGRRGHAVGQRH